MSSFHFFAMSVSKDKRSAFSVCIFHLIEEKHEKTPMRPKIWGEKVHFDEKTTIS